MILAFSYLDVFSKEILATSENNKVKVTNNIEIIDYKGFVKLVADNEKTQNWL